jgi:hypothetical protein
MFEVNRDFQKQTLEEEEEEEDVSILLPSVLSVEMSSGLLSKEKYT